jgi:hypothetical protein
VSIADLAPAPDGGALLVVGVDVEHAAGETEACQAHASFLLRLRADGSVAWSRMLPVNAAAAADSAGNVVLVVTLGASERGFAPGAGRVGPGISVAFLDAAGEPRWTRFFHGNADVGRPAFDAAGNLVLAGEVFDRIDIGGGAIEGYGGNSRLWMARFSPGGAYLSSRTFDGDDASGGAWSGGPDDRLDGIVVDTFGAIVLAGNYAGGLDLGAGVLGGGNARRTFVARIAP